MIAQIIGHIVAFIVLVGLIVFMIRLVIIVLFPSKDKELSDKGL